jgi:hypothetical protein
VGDVLHGAWGGGGRGPPAPGAGGARQREMLSSTHGLRDLWAAPPTLKRWAGLVWAISKRD